MIGFFRPNLVAISALASICICISAPANANAGVLDPRRIFIPLGPQIGLSLPLDVAAMAGHAGSTTLSVAGKSGPSEGYDETVGLFRVRLAPGLVASGNTWPVFQFYQLQMLLDARYYAMDTAHSDLEKRDPLVSERMAWNRTRLIEAYALAAGKHLALKVGLVRPQWGAGLLANNHAAPQPGVAASPFGSSQWVDHTFRIQLAAFPLGHRIRNGKRRTPMTIALAADGTIEDAHSIWTRGDRTYTGIVALKLDIGRFNGGIYSVYRHQTHFDGGRTELAAFDFTGRVNLLNGPVKLWALTEVALVLGQTDYTQSVMTDEDFSVFSAGGVFRLGLEWKWLETVLELGLASGDDNHYDTQLNAFSFNAGYRVGLLMFPSAGRIASHVSAFNIANPEYRDVPPRGIERLSQRGVVSGATYFNPRIGLTPTKNLTLMVGLLWAQSQGAYTDAFWSGIAGGQSVGPNGATDAKDLGVELDLGIRYDWEMQAATLTIRAEFAYFKPGAVFAAADGTRAKDQMGGWLHLNAAF